MTLNEPAHRRMRSFRLEAVVLRHNDWGEADRILGLYTLEMGKLRALAKGVRKLRSRKAGHLEPFTRVSLLLARGRDMPLITQADTLDPYLPLHEDLSGATYASYVVELLEIGGRYFGSSIDGDDSSDWPDEDYAPINWRVA